MGDLLLIHRLHFGFTLVFHYLFPQLTMGLALLIALLESLSYWKKDEALHEAARFWARVFGINFVIGVVTGIPMEFQFGTNWAPFSRYAGGVIGQTLALEGVFAFFAESTFLGLFLYGEGRIGRKGTWAAAVLVFVGSWLSGYFITATNAFMQHPVGYAVDASGKLAMVSLWQVLTNPWLVWEYAHVMTGATQTGAFAMAGVGALYLLQGRFEAQARTFVRTGVLVGALASVLQIFPSGDAQGRLVAQHQPATLAALEGLFRSAPGAPLAFVGQPDMQRRRLDNPIELGHALSFLTWRRWTARVEGLDAFPVEDWPTNVPLVYYAYHVMVGLGTFFIAIQLGAAFLLWRRKLFASRPMLWVLLLAIPFPYVANTAGWVAAEAGRQPWLVHGLYRTPQGASYHVSSGNALFSLLGFTGAYALLAILFLFLVGRELARGPVEGAPAHEG
ncbi:cytochrome ubiquinol oxidase subunit I [Anaeromyxobacter paludicola]|uniref:Cytochrome ubiquinol oxidase subunit I n=1 Tax=Anaeromyxobacter paludicola TaxID=2918171 RepID=A0ABN6N5T6_9BACT|nr:cytochrome ubiquinol oxidase subunit I [Anaeromyxobacter paludicola]BDG08544.1 cytochrome ubiquinol oxidase subunit I [Anaeromyxobacter paludicola]